MFTVASAALFGAIYAAHVTVPICCHLSLEISGSVLRESPATRKAIVVHDGRAQLAPPAGAEFSIVWKMPF